MQIGIGLSLTLPRGRAAPAPFAGALDGLSVSAAAAYSPRRLRAGYTGPALRVRRSSDNAEADIGFTAAGDLDTAALLAFCGAGDGFVPTWYDQSGNGRNAGQATAASQPRIVNAGVVEMMGARPAIVWSVGQILLNQGSAFGNGEAFSCVLAFERRLADTSNRSLFGNRPTFASQGRLLRTTLSTVFLANIAGPSLTRSIVNATPEVVSVVCEPGVNMRMRVGGGPDATNSSTAYIESSVAMTLGSAGQTGELFRGATAEYAFFDAALSDTDRQTLERNQGAYFGVTVL